MSFKPGDVVTETVEVTDEMVRLFAKCSGDENPIHLDEDYAKKTRFGKRIAHGILSGALISRVLAMKLGPGGIYLSQSLKFLQPIYIGDKVIVTCKVMTLREEKGIASIETLVTKSTGELAVKGEAIIMQGNKV